MLTALEELGLSKRQRMNAPSLSEDELSDLENDLTYIAAVSRLLQQMSIQ